MKKKINKKLLAISILASAGIITPAIITACKNDDIVEEKPNTNDQKTPEENKEKNEGSVDKQGNNGQNVDVDSMPKNEETLKKIAESIRFELLEFSVYPTNDRSSLFVTQIEDGAMKFAIQNKDYERIINFRAWKTPKLDPIYGRDTGIQTGILNVSFAISFKPHVLGNKEDPIKDKEQILERQYEGFKKNASGIDHTGTIVNAFDSISITKNEYDDYAAMTLAERYQYDNKKYFKALKEGQHRGASIGELRPELASSSTNATAIEKYNKLAAEVGIDSFESAAYKGFTVPVFNDKGEVDGLSIWDKTEVGKAPSRVDSFGRDNEYKTIGLARILPNEKYKQAAIQTYSLNISNDDPSEDDPKKQSQIGGTIWILDYEKPTDGSKYPTRWFFATNLHVADGISEKTNSIALARLNEDVALRNRFKLVNNELKEGTNYQSFILPNVANKDLFKVVYRGKDFLKSKPSDFLNSAQKDKFKDYEDFADFAVIELDLSKFPVDDPEKNIDLNGRTIEEFAKDLTNNYANKIEDHIKFRSSSYLKDYEAINYPLRLSKGESNPKTLESLYIAGYPSTANEMMFLDQYEDYDQVKWLKGNRSLWINSDYRYYETLVSQEGAPQTYTEEKLNQGNYLSQSLGYRSFINKPGLADGFISASHFGNNFFSEAANPEKKYVLSGLNYLPRHYAPAGGASGSSVRNNKNELVAIFHGANGFARTGLAQAFRSEGYNYHGAYGTYNLPQYDLIYGGGKDQKTSYREALKNLYPDMQTNLFPNGLADDQVPAKFKFDGENSVIDPKKENTSTKPTEANGSESDDSASAANNN